MTTHAKTGYRQESLRSREDTKEATDGAEKALSGSSEMESRASQITVNRVLRSFPVS
jgi:hypothetical protein